MRTYQVDEIVKILQENSRNVPVERVDRSVPLPPSSLQSFLKKDAAIPGVVITNHKAAFTNPFYNSEWDSGSNLDMRALNERLASVALAVSATVYQLATGTALPSNVTANSTLVRIPASTSFMNDRTFYSYCYVVAVGRGV